MDIWLQTGKFKEKLAYNEEDRQCTHNVTLRRFLTAIVDVK